MGLKIYCPNCGKRAFLDDAQDFWKCEKCYAVNFIIQKQPLRLETRFHFEAGSESMRWYDFICDDCGSTTQQLRDSGTGAYPKCSNCGISMTMMPDDRTD